jgi:hypothetical protein
MTGYSWDTYQYIEEQGLLKEVEKIPWENGGMSAFASVHIAL